MKYLIQCFLAVIMFYVLRNTSPALGFTAMLAVATLPAVKYSYRYALAEDRR